MKMRKYYWLLSFFLTLALGLNIGCSDDNDFFTNERGSSIEIKKNFKVSEFFLDSAYWNTPDSVIEIRVNLRSLTDNSEQDFDVEIKRDNMKRTFRLLIPKGERIADSDYLMKGLLLNGRSLGHCLKVTFKDEMLGNVLAVSVEYSLDGEGTETKPFLIENNEDFSKFLTTLGDDETNAAGLFFIQTADLDNVEVIAHDFAGNYNGRGHQINYVYMGNQNEVGLFSELKSGAVIKCLSISTLLRNVGQNVGTIAGKASGNVEISSVKINEDVNIESENELGGMIGFASNANLLIHNCKISGSFKGRDNVGGVIGKVEGGKLIIKNLFNYQNNMIYVEGNKNVGFVAGSAEKTGLDFNKVMLRYTTSDGQNDLKVIYAKEENGGGLVGKANLTSESVLDSVLIYAPIKGRDYLGGLFGRIYYDSKVSIKATRVTTCDIVGHGCLGGFFGGLDKMGNSDLIIGDSYHTCKVLPRQVKGDGNYVGGLCGTWHGDAKLEGEVVINGLVIGKEYVGGVCGDFKNGSISVNLLDIDAAMRVNGSQYVGGMFGFISNAQIYSQTKIDFSSKPDTADFVADFKGTISGENEGTFCNIVGGIVGMMERSTVSGLCFNGTISGNDAVGGIVGKIKPNKDSDKVERISHCVNCSIKELSATGWWFGGIIGKIENSSYIDHVCNMATIKGKDRVGGIAGGIQKHGSQTNHTLEYMVNMGNIKGTNVVGGCVAEVGKSRHTDISSSANYGYVSSTSIGCVGGIVGMAIGELMYYNQSYNDTDAAAVIKHCANHGTVHAHVGGNPVMHDEFDETKVGGIVGSLGQDPSGTDLSVYKNGAAYECCNKGEVKSDYKDSYIGGIVGIKEEGYRPSGNDSEAKNWRVSDCYNAGSLPSKADTDVGGIVGYYDRNNYLMRCYNVGRIEHGRPIRGYTKGGKNNNHSDSNYFLGSSCDTDEEYGKSEEDMKKQETFEGYDFNKVWKMDGYPILRNCPFQNKKF